MIGVRRRSAARIPISYPAGSRAKKILDLGIPRYVGSLTRLRLTSPWSIQADRCTPNPAYVRESGSGFISYHCACVEALTRSSRDWTSPPNDNRRHFASYPGLFVSSDVPQGSLRQANRPRPSSVDDHVSFRRRLRNRAPAPPPFSLMNSTPAASKARPIARSFAMVISVSSFSQFSLPDGGDAHRRSRAQAPPQLPRISARAVRISCAGQARDRSS